MPPFVQELRPAPDPFEQLRRFRDWPGLLLLESTAREKRLGRYSFLMADPIRWFERRTVRHGADPFGEIAAALADFPEERIPDLPPFQGGAAGLLSYELGGAFERLPAPRPTEMPLPVLAIGIYPWVIAWDHVRNRAWLISHGEQAASARRRANMVLDRLNAPPPPESKTTSFDAVQTESNFSREDYCRTVERIIEYIRAGDIFQANLAQQLSSRTDLSPEIIYGRLRRANPAPFSAFFADGDWAIASSSPERFLRVENGHVETRPIKGTRPRRGDPTADRAMSRELAASEKDRAENVMIVDLLRNDLSRVCRPGSVRVPERCIVESYETVHHLVSTIVGELESGRSVWDLFAAAFPGGSITGAPKIRAMEIIAELEPTPRGPYCGSLFYVGFDGGCDSSILIRTMALRGGQCRIGAGGGITALSEPLAEYEETLDKARGLLRVFEGEEGR